MNHRASIEVKALTVEHLQLPVRTTNALHTNRILSIGDLLEREVAISAGVFHLGEGNNKNAIQALNLLRGVMDTTGNVDWRSYWDNAPWGIVHLAFSCQEFTRIGSLDRAASIRTLHFDKAATPLEFHGVTTIESLLAHLKNGLPKLSNFGAKAHGEVRDAAIALSKSILAEGTVDWIKFAELMNISVLPSSPWQDTSPQSFIIGLPPLIEEAVAKNFGNRELMVLRKRILAQPDKRPTLEEMGQVLGGITRERIRQLQEACLDLFRVGLLQKDYRGLKIRFRSEIADPLSEAIKHFDNVGLLAWRKSHWIDELARLWELSPAAVQQHLMLLSEILGFEEYTPECRDLESIIVSRYTTKTDAKKTIRVIDAIHETLAQHPVGLDAFDLASNLVRRLGKAIAPSLDEVPIFVQLTSSISCTEADFFRCAFHLLGNRADQAYRILWDFGRPMHGTEITRELNRLCVSVGETAISDRTLLNAMSNDDRHMPIGKSGLWSLKDWGIEGRSIIDLIEDALHQEGAVLSKDRIYEVISSKRPLAFASVGLLLENNPDRFKKVGWSLWGLASWKDIETNVSAQPTDVGSFIDRFFLELGAKRIEFSKLRRAFESSTGLHSKSAQGILSFHPAIDVERPDSHTRIAVYQSDWRDQPRSNGTHKSKRPSIRDRIADAVRLMLNSESTHEVLLTEAAAKIAEKLGTTKPSVYAVISQNDEFETVNVESKVFKILRFAAGVKPEFPEVALIKNGQWANELRRALSKLTTSDVDVALFMLGRQFDVAMKALVANAQKRGSPVVTKDHDKNLSSRIDWALANGFLHNAATMKLLREERNSRAHDEAPPLSERERMMKDAPFLAGLYLNAFIDIESHIS